jgi:hypothetical protein
MLTSIIAGAAFASVSTVQGADTRLAIRGYDPVAYFIEARPMVGDPRFEQEWDGVTYRFASARHLELFKADPERYLPQYSNWCTASMSRGEKVVGEPENWLIHEGRLYLFGKPIGPGLMRQDPVAMKTRADGNWAKLAQDGPAIAPQ